MVSFHINTHDYLISMCVCLCVCVSVCVCVSEFIHTYIFSLFQVSFSLLHKLTTDGLPYEDRFHFTYGNDS